MKKRSERLSRIAQLRALARQRAQRTLGHDLKSLAQSREQHQLLLGYQSSYQSGMEKAVMGNTLLNQRAFLQSIGRAVSQQEEQVRQDTLRVRMSRARWMESWRAANAMDEWVSELQKQERTDLDRRQQLSSDDLLSTRYRKE